MSLSIVREVLVKAGLFLVMFVVMSGLAHAAGTGAEIVEFTGGATQIFESMRAVNFVRGVGIAMFAIALIAGFGGVISGGWATLLGCLLLLGGWFGAEPIVDTIFSSGVVF